MGGGGGPKLLRWGLASLSALPAFAHGHEEALTALACAAGSRVAAEAAGAVAGAAFGQADRASEAFGDGITYADDELPEPTIADLKRHRLAEAAARHLTAFSWRVAAASAPRERAVAI